MCSTKCPNHKEIAELISSNDLDKSSTENDLCKKLREEERVSEEESNESNSMQHALFCGTPSKELGNILIWTHCYYVMERSAKIHKRLCRENSGSSKTSEVSHHSYVVREEDKGDYETLLPQSTKVAFDEWNCKNDTCVEAETNSRRLAAVSMVCNYNWI